jgi:probable phosphoglycerate mutase
MGQEIQQYIDYRKDAWQVVYGNLKGFDGAGFWMDAQRTMGRDPEAMVVGYLDRTPVGMIQLSPDRDAYKKVGYIPFLYLREPFRHKGLGIQLIGHSISFYRKLGREKLQLSVAPTNEKALGFYDKFGFHAVGKNRGRFGKLILMEKDISAPKLPKKLKVIPKG